VGGMGEGGRGGGRGNVSEARKRKEVWGGAGEREELKGGGKGG